MSLAITACFHENMQQNALSPHILPTQKFGQASAPTGRLVRSADLIKIRYCVLAYFFLWIFEGALRKWVVPSLANPLLLIRDPILLYIYYLSFRMNIFPRNIWVVSSFILSAYMAILGMIVLGNAPIVLYGWRTVFLHFPLIWVIATVLNEQHLQFIERAVLIISPIIAGLMMMQFIAPPSSWLNAGASEGSSQIGSALGHVRPAATFSFITGPIYYFALTAAFLANSQLTQKRQSVPLLIIAIFSAMAASAVSGSRALIVYIGVVFLAALIAGLVLAPKLILRRPELIGRWVGGLAMLYIAGNLLLNVPVIQVGLEAFQVRIENASRTEGGAQGLSDRYFGGLLRFVPLLSLIPPMGYGLGLGTNVGAVLMTGEAQFTLGEDEWSRNVFESGPYLGTAFILWRIGITLWLLKRSVSCAVDNDPLPLLLFASVGLTLLSGNIGQPTTLGFVVFVSGLCLAAIRVKEARPKRVRAPIMARTAPALGKGRR